MRISDWSSDVCSSDLIGSYPDISLKQARDEAYEARRAVASGGDPAFEKRKRKIRAEFLSAQTFEAVAREYIEQMMVQNGRADGTIVKDNYFLDKLSPALGNQIGRASCRARACQNGY